MTELVIFGGSLISLCVCFAGVIFVERTFTRFVYSVGIFGGYPLFILTCQRLIEALGTK